MELLKYVQNCREVIGYGQVSQMNQVQSIQTIPSWLHAIVSLILLLFCSHFFLHESDKAIWLMPTENMFGPWPRSGEIDMVEIRGNDDLVCNGKQIGNRLMGSTLHFGLAFVSKLVQLCELVDN